MQSKLHQSISPNKGLLLLFLGLIPFATMHNISVMYIQVRGLPPAQFGLAALGYFLGLLTWTTLLPFVENKIIKEERTSKYWKTLLLIIFLSPGAFSLSSLVALQNPSAGTSLFNALQTFFWAILMPVAFRLFFHPMLIGMQGVFFGIIMAAGNLCAAFFVMIINQRSKVSPILSSLTGELYLPFLNITRSIAGIAFVIIAWYLICFNTEYRAEQNQRVALERDNSPNNTWVPTAFFWFFLLPFALCFFIYGFLNHRFFDQIGMQQLNSGYTYLGLTVLSLLAGFTVTNHGNGVLKKILIAALLCLAVSSFLINFVTASPLFNIIQFIYIANYQLLLFSVNLTCGFVFLRNRNSSLLVVSTLFVIFSAIPGYLLGKYLTLDQPTLVLVSIMCMGSLLAVFCVRRYFPLSTEVSQEVISTYNEEAAPTGTQKYTPEYLKRFAALHKLNNREIQVLEMLLRGLTSIEMVEVIGLKQSTVRTYTQNLLKKTGTNSRLELVTVFLAPPDPPSGNTD